MSEIKGTLHAPVIARIAEEVLLLIKSDATLRKVQGANAPQASYFDRQVGLASGTIYTITQALSGNEIFSSLVVTFDVASGAGFYRVDGQSGTLPTVGVEVPAGGGILTIMGHDNIRNFVLTAQTGQTLTFARYLYK